MHSKTHAFLVLAHNNPSHLIRFLRTLESPNHYFFVHIDKKSKEDFSELKEISNCTVIEKRVSCNWGGFSLVKATLNLIKKAYFSGHFSYFHLLSGADYFCSTNECFDRFFNDTDQSFLSISDSTPFEWRLKIYTFNDIINRRGKWKNILWHTDDIQKKLLKYFKIRKDLQERFYYGSQWFSLGHEIIHYVLKFCKKNPQFVRRFYLTFVPDESFFHMIIMNSPLAHKITQNNLRFIDWKRKVPQEPLPRTLDIEDYDDIVKSGSFFCRKVSLPKSAGLLNKLDESRKDEQI